MYSVLQKSIRRPPRLASIVASTHSRSLFLSTPLNSLSDRLQRRRTQSAKPTTAQDTPTHESNNKSSPSVSPQSKSQGNLSSDLANLAERAISADPVKEEEARKQRQREQVRANRVKWENKDRAKQIIEIKKGHTQATLDNNDKGKGSTNDGQREETEKGKEQDPVS